MAKAPQLNPMTQEELDAAFELPAVFVNKVYVTFSGGNARITFAELTRPDTLPKSRAAVSMSLSDLVGFKDVLVAMCASLQEVDIKPPRFDA